MLFGNGDGTFQPAVTYPSGGTSPVAVAVTDLNGDGRPDIVVVNSCVNCTRLLSVLLNNGDGTFAPAAYDSGGTSATAVAIADLNHDHKPDLLVSDFWSGTVGVLLGNGDGTFEPLVTSSVGGYGSVVGRPWAQYPSWW